VSVHDPTTLATPGYYTWEPAGKTVSVRIALDLVDRLSAAILDGFGSIPKRGAEIGGVLLGHWVEGEPRAVQIDDFRESPCEHKFGPSYVLSDEDLARFAETLLRAAADEQRVVGYFRSHTREGLALAPPDHELLAKHFPAPDHVVLLVRPSALTVSQAGFFLYQEGVIQESTDHEFPFRRSELESGEAPARRPLGVPPPSKAREPRPRGPSIFRQASPSALEEQAVASAPRRETSEYAELPFGLRPHDEGVPLPSQVYAVTTPSTSRFRRGWVWFPLSFIFLLLGVLLGFQAALSFNTNKSGNADPFHLQLSAGREGPDLNVKWDRGNPAIRQATRGVLDITDGTFNKRVDLDATQLQTGRVIYRFSSAKVRFRLEVYPRDRTLLSETVEWTGAPESR
jgi:hypothetical protein